MRVLGSVIETADDDTRQAVLALEPDHVVAEENGVEDETAGAVGDDLAPVRHGGGRERRLADPKVLRARRVGGDDEPVAVVLYGVFVAVLARRDDAR